MLPWSDEPEGRKEQLWAFSVTTKIYDCRDYVKSWGHVAAHISHAFHLQSEGVSERSSSIEPGVLWMSTCPRRSALKLLVAFGLVAFGLVALVGLKFIWKTRNHVTA